MPSIRIWTLESDNDAKAVKCLANKLKEYLKLEALSIDTTGKLKPPTRLRDAIQILLEDEDCIILVIDRDGPIAHHERLQQPNSIINQIKQIVNDPNFAGKVFLVEAIQELEAWLLIDCLGIFCYFATQRPGYRNNCRDKVSANRSLKSLVNGYQSGNTQKIVETEQGGRGAKEYLIRFSEKVLLALNPNMPLRNISREKYREALSPEIAKHIVINRETLQRNNSLKKLGDVITQFQ